MTMNELDALIHQPLRTRLVAYLAGAGELTFTELRRALDVSDGNLDAHLKKLLAAGYVSVRKETGQGRPQSFFALAPAGREALAQYVRAIQRILLPRTEDSPASPVEGARLGCDGAT